VRLYSIEDIPEFIAEGCFIHGIWRRLLRGGLLRPCFICGRLGVNGRGEGASGYPARVHDPFSQDHSGFLRDGGFLHAPGQQGAQIIQREVLRKAGGHVRSGV
jgi:hypothetical protein